MNSNDNSNKKIVKYVNRDTLYERFKNGSRPSENDFHDLINSTLNKLDDGIAKDFENGLQLAPQGKKGEKVISLYHHIDDPMPSWTISLTGNHSQKNLSIQCARQEHAQLTITPDGKIGIGTNSPEYDIDIQGVIASQTRIGTFAKGIVKANGEWQTILSGLKDCTQFEITAVARGIEGRGKYAVLHAIASNAFAGNGGRIRCTRNHYSWKWWRRIGLRWVGSPFNYGLQIKTYSDFGKESNISYHITRLWQENLAENSDVHAENINNQDS